MAKPRSRRVDLASYLVFRLIAAFLRALSFRTANSCAVGFAYLIMKLQPKRVAIARDNLRQAYPGQYDEIETERMVAKVYQHFCRVIVEVLHLDHLLQRSSWRERFEFATLEDFRRFTDVSLGERPVMMVTGHFGNWELSSYILGLLGFPGYAIARPLDNPYVDRWLRRWREGTGQKLIAKNGEFDLIEKALREGSFLGTLGDQDAGQRPVRAVLQSACINA